MPQQSISTITGFGQLGDLPCLKLQCGQARAVISLYGGQLLSYQPTAGNEVLWLSDKAQWHNGAAIRGGVPVCWPWFGPADDKIKQHQSLPNHGLVRNRFWQLADSRVSADSVSVTLSITVTDIPPALWPADSAVISATGNTISKPMKLLLNLLLSDSELTIQLKCDTSLYQQAALHSYFRVSDLQQARVKGLSEHYFDKVANVMQISASNETGFNGETDRIYYNTSSQLQLIDQQKQLTVIQNGHDASVIWNPGQQKSRDLPDMADCGFTEFVCAETARLDVTTANELHLLQTIRARQ
ncbi:D-hexose-6-phosphate mutarotase [Arsukibacterium indicum]|uniref:Putative glucose-6-phosphate 1-epimerase n=1 Tax=Arsukibacterium indicum TaxID=2848612 RepID=A0ABS6MLR3_9GAMM|nr:D-hexose-6-phosphate mutarotase [Arsukibacterium indicum]MBV2129734.1 D-hexose-6-phosphate mutarotase [Arsukibacterium indicum]